jgi:hypothetical protein
MELDLTLIDRPPTTVAEIVPIGPNLLATLGSFIALLAAPWICLHTLEGLWEDAIGEDPVATLFVLANPAETLFIAAAGGVFFLVIGVILQVWWHHWPFPSRRAIVLAFVIAGCLIVPESLLRGGSLVSGLVVASAVALAFTVHWEILTRLSEAMD